MLSLFRVIAPGLSYWRFGRQAAVVLGPSVGVFQARARAAGVELIQLIILGWQLSAGGGVGVNFSGGVLGLPVGGKGKAGGVLGGIGVFIPRPLVHVTGSLAQ